MQSYGKNIPSEQVSGKYNVSKRFHPSDHAIISDSSHLLTNMSISEHVKFAQ